MHAYKNAYINSVLQWMFTEDCVWPIGEGEDGCEKGDISFNEELLCTHVKYKR